MDKIHVHKTCTRHRPALIDTRNIFICVNMSILIFSLTEKRALVQKRTEIICQDKSKKEANRNKHSQIYVLSPNPALN